MHYDWGFIWDWYSHSKNQIYDNDYHDTKMRNGATERVLTLNELGDRLPIFTKGRDPNKIQATDIYVLTPSALAASKLVLKHNSNEETFNDGVAIGSMKSFVIKDISLAVTNWELHVKDLNTDIDKLWIVVRYILK